MDQPKYGGEWTKTKLDKLDKYLRGYTRIFESNRSARFFTTVYVDAFAGTGRVALNTKELAMSSLFSELLEPETESYLKGSAQIALDVQPQFDQYLFQKNTPWLATDLRVFHLRC